MSIIEEIFNILAPHQCLGCGFEGDLLCKNCVRAIEPVQPRCYACGRPSDNFRTCTRCRRRSPLFSVAAALYYDGTAKELLHALKFGRAKAGARTAARILADSIPTDMGIDIITYAPTVPARARLRGYDQSELIAKGVARQLGLPCIPLLARVGSARQVGQQRAARLRQMEHAFRPVHMGALQNKHVLVVDDVLTTGATCEAAARTLKAAGAARVSAAVFAVA